MLWDPAWLCICFIIIIIILVRFMQPPCMLNVVQFTACLLAHLLACVCLAKLWSTKRPRNFGSRAWFEIDWQNVVSSRTVRLCRDFALTRCGTFPQVYRGTGTLLYNVGRLLWAYRIDVDVVAHRWTFSRGVLHRRERLVRHCVLLSIYY